jgi:hypothetical protein
MSQQKIFGRGEVITADQLPASTRIPGLGRIDYYQNWNGKLDNEFYTSIRLNNPAKYVVGRTMAVTLNSKRKHDAKIHDVKTFRLDDITEWVARIDTGLSREECIRLFRRMYENQAIDWTTQKLNLVLFQNLEYAAQKKKK